MQTEYSRTVPPPQPAPVEPKQTTVVAAHPEVINSMSHPKAYAFLQRSCKDGKELVPKEIVDQWRAGGTHKSKLLQTFVRKIYVEGATQNTNCLRLEAYVKLRQATRDWATSMQGYEWRTEEELGENGLKWSTILGMFFLKGTLCVQVLIHLYNFILSPWCFSFFEMDAFQ